VAAAAYVRGRRETPPEGLVGGSVAAECMTYLAAASEPCSFLRAEWLLNASCEGANPVVLSNAAKITAR